MGATGTSSSKYSLGCVGGDRFPVVQPWHGQHRRTHHTLAQLFQDRGRQLAEPLGVVVRGLQPQAWVSAAALVPGVVAYEPLEGAPPFTGPYEHDYQDQHLPEPCRPSPQLRP
ncbi:hypothetical protein IQ64_47680 [Streptomyces stelliscabiei]|nr:hypothetical protein IQ64_47680 [Streptomyces stelliscabiei]